MQHLSGPLLEPNVLFFEVILGFFGQIRSFSVGEPLCDVGVPSRVLITLLRVIYQKKSGWLPMYHVSDPLTEPIVIRILGKTFGVFWSVQAATVAGELLYDA